MLTRSVICSSMIETGSESYRFRTWFREQDPGLRPRSFVALKRCNRLRDHATTRENMFSVVICLAAVAVDFAPQGALPHSFPATSVRSCLWAVQGIEVRAPLTSGRAQGAPRFVNLR